MEIQEYQPTLLPLRRILARLIYYPTLGWNLLLHRLLAGRHWWDRVDQHVLIGALPFAADAERLHAEGIRAVVNTCEEYAGPKEAYDRLGIEQLRIPTVDFVAPSIGDVEQAINFMEGAVREGKQVYVHCKAGRGRSATVVLCWLMASRRLSAEEAQALLLQKRAHVNPRLYRRRVVLDFARKGQQKDPQATPP